MKNWTLHRRINSGFAALVVVLVSLAALSVGRMREVSALVAVLHESYAVQSAKAASLAAAANRSVLAVDHYEQSPEAENWTEANDGLAAVAAALADTDDFCSAHPELTVLQRELARTKPAFAQYGQAVQDFGSATMAFQTAWAAMNDAGQRVFDALSSTIASLEVSSQSASTRGRTSSEIHDFVRQERILGDAYRSAAEMRLLCWQAMADGDQEAPQRAREMVATCAERLRELRNELTRQSNVRRIDDALSALAVFEEGATTLENALQARETARAARLAAHADFSASVDAIAGNAFDAMGEKARTSRNGAARTVVILVCGGVAGTLLGALVAVVITRSTRRLLAQVVDSLRRGAFETAASARLVAGASQKLAAGASRPLPWRRPALRLRRWRVPVGAMPRVPERLEF